MSIKKPLGLSTFFIQTILSTQSSALQHKKKSNVQFKVISALFFATLVAAATVPGGTNPGTNTDPSKTPTTNPTSGNTNQGANPVEPPYPATSGSPPPIILASKCSPGHLRCCESAGLPTDSSVVAQLPSGISKDSFSGYAGIGCSKLPDGSKPATCPKKPLCCTDIVNSIGCNKVTLGE